MVVVLEAAQRLNCLGLKRERDFEKRKDDASYWAATGERATASARWVLSMARSLLSSSSSGHS